MVRAGRAPQQTTPAAMLNAGDNPGCSRAPPAANVSLGVGRSQERTHNRGLSYRPRIVNAELLTSPACCARSPETMITENLPARAPSLRSRTRPRAAAVRHFVDPSFAVAAVRATPERLPGDLRWLGLLFENLLVSP
jgi:hypothetical protein